MDHDQIAASKAKSNPGFLIPKLPVKKPPQPTDEQLKSKSAAISRLINPPIDDYVPPSWAELPTGSDHTIEVMNNGVITARHRLKDMTKKSFITIGRMDTCDIHASIAGASRLHCYLQYGDGFDGRGWYVLDKASTQGTFVNKNEVPKSVFFKIRSGSIIQITKSNFHLYLEGTDDTLQPKTVVAAEVQYGGQPRSPESNFIEELKAKNERSFEKDPIGVLSRYCEREGLEFKLTRLASDKEEKGYSYSFELPDDVSGGNGGSFTGIGQDVLSAQRNCALQVCRHLNEIDRLSYDVHKKTRKNMEDNEFYEEDEDTFYDRTGQVETQRLKRIERHKATFGIKDKAMTYPELLSKISSLEDSRAAVHDQIERMVHPQDGSRVSPEEIDISSLNASLSVRLETSKLKRKYEQLTNEINTMRKAADIAKPFEIKMPTRVNVVETPKEPEKQEERSSASLLQTKLSEIPKPSVQKDVEPTTSNERAKGPSIPPPPKTGEKKFGLLTRKELQAQKNATLNKRRMAEESIDDDVAEEKRNKTDEFEEPDDIIDWTAPTGQTGDGMTELNKRYGY